MIKEHFDAGSLVVIIITLTLFIVALFTKGFTHDLLLEIGIFLVSVKLILMGYKNSVNSKAILDVLDDIKKTIKTEH